MNKREKSFRSFGIVQELRYKILGRGKNSPCGSGNTISMSSKGVQFTTEDQLTVGLPVELSIHWPVLLNGVCPMKLMVYGLVMSSPLPIRGKYVTSLKIEKHEFRTAGPLVAVEAAA
jgi:hypothetical protein